MKKGARVIIEKDGKILFLHRIKGDREYYVIPGGTIEEGEEPEEAAIREIKEETNFDVDIEFLWEINDRAPIGDCLTYFFLAKEFTGEMKLGSPEIDRQSETNKYLLEWISLSKIKDLLIYPEGTKERLFELFS